MAITRKPSARRTLFNLVLVARDECVARVHSESCLGGPVSEIHQLPAGLKFRTIGVDPLSSPTRAVHLAYGNDSRSLVLLTISRGNITSLDVAEHHTFGIEIYKTARAISAMCGTPDRTGLCCTSIC